MDGLVILTSILSKRCVSLNTSKRKGKSGKSTGNQNSFRTDFVSPITDNRREPFCDGLVGMARLRSDPSFSLSSRFVAWPNPPCTRNRRQERGNLRYP
ncbi:hypothetical protein NPIL_635441 [Nephila pilipes]|uniref:Uncharacterized protein n=1 Tax=Nephila pilipes TaxID=299642 RepID=A0A8X6PE27_NEPPI|nr:hypothetical protein NPIL_635441 [Nephila pilipes]